MESILGKRAVNSTLRALGQATKEVNSLFNKLASGKRINSAADDAAGLTIVGNLGAGAAIAAQDVRNANDAISLSHIADGALASLGSIAERQTEIATLAANGTLSDSERATLDLEFQALNEEAERIVAVTEFNGIKVFEQPVVTQVGGDSSANSQIRFTPPSTIGVTGSGLGVGTQAVAQAAIDQVKSVINNISAGRGEIGAFQSRIGVAIQDRETFRVSALEAKARIEDDDIADTTSKLTAAQIRQEAGTAVLAQANVKAAIVNRLLG